MTVHGMAIRLLEIADMPELSSLLEEAFDISVARYLTYSQHGIVTLLSLQIRYPASFDPKCFYVATVEGRLAGFAEFRLPEMDHGFLCYICVAEPYRRQGISGRLIQQFESDHPNVQSLDLDVFEHNHRARQAYQRFGFEPAGLKYWHRRPLPDATSEVVLTDLMTSAASFKMYGFCRLIANGPGGPVTVGRIGPTVLRCYDLMTFGDDQLLGGLRATFPGLREALVIDDASCATDARLGDGTWSENSVGAPIRSYRLRRRIKRETGHS